MLIWVLLDDLVDVGGYGELIGRALILWWHVVAIAQLLSIYLAALLHLVGGKVQFATAAQLPGWPTVCGLTAEDVSSGLLFTDH